MLIIPIQNKPDWSRPPLITLSLILINLLVFVFYQGNDNSIAERATEIYQQNNLFAVERQPYLDYLQEVRPEDYAELSASSDTPLADLTDAMLYWSLFYDLAFDAHLRELWHNADSNPALHEWRQHRQQFEQERNRLSSIEAGLIPAEARPWTFISSMFMHGSWDHLLGNMAFLFLFGFTLESALRPLPYLAMYLASGLAASGLYVMFSSGSFIPLVGASGAVSGLMGMYLSLYRLRKIRFFYSFLFYFGEVTAPALLILPLWLGKELYGHLFIDSNIAYWAHIGGLLAGAGLIFLTPKSLRAFDQIQQQVVQQDEAADMLKKIRSAMNRLDHSQALALARRLCESYPTDVRGWRSCVELTRLQPQQRAYHQAVFNFLKQFSASTAAFATWAASTDEVLQDYRRLAPQAPALNGNLCLALARIYWRHHDTEQAQRMVQWAVKRRAKTAPLLALLKEMRDHHGKRAHAPHSQTQALALTALIEQLQAIPAPVVNPQKVSTSVD